MISVESLGSKSPATKCSSGGTSDQARHRREVSRNSRMGDSGNTNPAGKTRQIGQIPIFRLFSGASSHGAAAAVAAAVTAAGIGSGFKFLLSSKRARGCRAGPLYAARCRRGLQRENREGRAWTGGGDARGWPRYGVD